MNVRLFGAISAGFIVAACGSVSEVIPAGKDTFLVESHGVIGNGSAAYHKAKVYQLAGERCRQQGKELQPITVNQVESAFGRAPSAELQFRCLAAGDPELKRPNMLPAPSTTIIEQR